MTRFAILLALALPACTPFHPVVDVANQDSIFVRYDAFKSSAGEASSIANQHCASYGRRPILVSNERNGFMRGMLFHCID